MGCSADPLAKLVIEAFRDKIPPFLGNPLRQPEVWLDDGICARVSFRLRLSVTGSAHPMALQNGRPGGVDVGHQFVGRLVAAVGVVALGEDEIGGGEFLGGDRPDVDPEPPEE